MLDSGVDAEYVAYTGPLMMTVISVVGNLLRNVMEHSKLGRWLG